MYLVELCTQVQHTSLRLSQRCLGPCLKAEGSRLGLTGGSLRLGLTGLRGTIMSSEGERNAAVQLVGIQKPVPWGAREGATGSEERCHGAGGRGNLFAMGPRKRCADEREHCSSLLLPAPGAAEGWMHLHHWLERARSLAMPSDAIPCMAWMHCGSHCGLCIMMRSPRVGPRGFSWALLGDSS